MFDLIQQHKGFGEVIQATENVGDTQNAEEISVIADQDVVDVSLVRLRVDVHFRIDETSRLKCLAHWHLDGFELAADTPQVTYSLAE